MNDLSKQSKVAAAVILYNPGYDVLGNLKSYVHQVAKLYIIDNSDSPYTDIIDEIRKLNTVYLNNKSNIGIAAALNIAAKMAIKDNFDYLLTMDQDSKVSENLVDCLYEIAKTDDKIGIVVGEYINPEIVTGKKALFTKEILYTMTSGNLVNLSAFKKIGDFWEELFIDHVDHEYCLRMKSFGYKIVKTNKSFIYHKVGNVKIKNLILFRLSPSFHSPLRLYYRMRNRFYVNRKYKKVYPAYVKEDIRHLIKDLIEITLFEPQLKEKIKMMIKGYIHYRKGILGKYDATK